MPPQASPLDALPQAIAGAEGLDTVAKPVGQAYRSLDPGPVRDALSGRWIGHALHPLLTDVVIGSWTSATVLDLIGGPDGEAAAERLIGVGIAAYVPTALTGGSDWADSEATDDDVRRIGLAHALINVTALALYGASLSARRGGRTGRGKLLALAGAGVLSAAGFLGGHLSFRLGVGVDQTAFDAGPEDWTPVLDADEVPATGAVAAQAGDTPVLLVRRGERIAALHDRCTHRGCSLADGEIEGDAVTCACHGSRFGLGDGAVLRGPATAPQPVLDVRERDGRLEVRERG
jgi:nitrite reductase/ring-hydroxylating ferredoxin subunit